MYIDVLRAPPVLLLTWGWEKTSYVVHPTPCLVLLLKEFDDDRGEHFGVNQVGLTFERLAAGVWQDFGQCISGMVYPGVARTTICNQHRQGHLDPAISW